MTSYRSIQETDSDRLTLEKRQVFIIGAINDECANVTIAKLLYLQMQDSKAPVSLFINSPGASPDSPRH